MSRPTCQRDGLMDAAYYEDLAGRPPVSRLL